MSLLLRKNCQELLDGVNLNNYHIQVDPNSKCLMVVGECGQELVAISGIRLSRMAPHQTEIDLAVELFDAFVTKHHQTFKEFTIAKNAADAAHIPKHITELPDATVTKKSYTGHWVLTVPTKNYPNTAVEITSAGKVFIPATQIENYTQNPHTEVLLTPTENKAILNWLAACSDYNTALKRKTELLTKIATCEI